MAALELHDQPQSGGIGGAAAEIGLPRRTLKRALEREGITFREIARALRMQRARHLLMTTETRLAEVALRVGYTDPANSTAPSWRIAD